MISSVSSTWREWKCSQADLPHLGSWVFLSSLPGWPWGKETSRRTPTQLCPGLVTALTSPEEDWHLTLLLGSGCLKLPVKYDLALPRMSNICAETGSPRAVQPWALEHPHPPVPQKLRKNIRYRIMCYWIMNTLAWDLVISPPSLGPEPRRLHQIKALGTHL